jgi:hypothetical protein
MSSIIDRACLFVAGAALSCIAMMPARADDYCITLTGSVQATYVGKAFAPPTAGNCQAWLGFCYGGCSPDNVQTGVGCTASDGSNISFGLTTSYLAGNRQFDWVRLGLPGQSGSGNLNYQNPSLGTTNYNASGGRCLKTPIVISRDEVMTMVPTEMAVYPGASRVYVGGVSYEADGKNLAVLPLNQNGDIVGPAVFYPETTISLAHADVPTFVQDILVDAITGRLYVAWSEGGATADTNEFLSVYTLDSGGNVMSGPISYSCGSSCSGMYSLAINHTTKTLYAGVNSTGGMIVAYPLDASGDPTGQPVSWPRGGDGYIRQLAISSDGKYLYAAGSAVGLETFKFVVDSQGKPTSILDPAPVQSQAKLGGTARFSYSPQAIFQRQDSFGSTPTTIPLSVWPLQDDIPVASGPIQQTSLPPIIDVSASGGALVAAQLYTPSDVFTRMTGVVGANIQVYLLGAAGIPIAPPPTNSLTTIPWRYPLITASSVDGIPVILTSALGAPPGTRPFDVVNVTHGYQIFVSLIGIDNRQCPSSFTVRQYGGTPISGSLIGGPPGVCSATEWLALDSLNALQNATGQVMFEIDASPAPSPATYQIQIGQPANVTGAGTGGIQALATLTDTLSVPGSTSNPVLFLLPGYAYLGDPRPAMETLSGHAQRYQAWASAVATPQGFRPSKFTISAFGLWLGEGSASLLTESASALSSLGFNTVVIALPGAPSLVALEDSMLTGYGIPNRELAIATPPCIFDYQFNADSNCVTKLMSSFKGYYSSESQVKETYIWDEPGWYYPDVWNPAPAGLLTEYQPYMALQGFPNATPVGRAEALDTSPPANRGEFYWTTKFFDQAVASAVQRYAQNIKSKFESAFVSMSWPAHSVFGQTYLQSFYKGGITTVDNALQRMDWFLSGRMSANGLLTEDWFPDVVSEEWSFIGDELRSAAALGTQRLGGLVVGSQTGSHPVGASYKILSLVGQGAKVIDVYGFGPSAFMPGNSLLPNRNSWSDYQATYAPVANALRRIGQTESVLYPGMPTRSKVAVQLPGASALWFPISSGCASKAQTSSCPIGMWELYSLESEGLHYALEHAGYSVDFVDDADLAAPDLLSQRGYQILYVTQLNISAAAQQQIAKWVTGGGTVVATAGAGLWDESNTLSPGSTGTLLDVLGLQVPPLTGTSPWAHLRDQDVALANATSGLSSAYVSNQGLDANISQVKGPLQIPPGLIRFFAAPLSPVDPGDVVAQFTGPGVGSATTPVPAVTVHKYGPHGGTAIAYGFFPGTEYYVSQEQLAPDQLPTHWDTNARTRATTPVLEAKVLRNVFTDTPLVEALRLDSSAGTGIVLLNWNDWHAGESPLPVTVTVTGAAGKRVTSAEGNPITTHTVGPDPNHLGDLNVTLSMKNVDILTIE